MSFARIIMKVKTWIQLDLPTTLRFRLRFKFSRNVSPHIYPKSILNIDKTAYLDFIKGTFKINATWTGVGNEEYVRN